MIKLGAACIYRKYASDQRLYAFEKQTGQERAGLWGLPEAQQVPPWELRRAR